MGFLDKAKKLAEQAQTKLDEVQKQVNTQGSPGAAGGPITEYDKHGRPIPPQQTATPPHGDPLAAGIGPRRRRRRRPDARPAAPPALGPRRRRRSAGPAPRSAAPPARRPPGAAAAAPRRRRRGPTRRAPVLPPPAVAAAPPAVARRARRAAVDRPPRRNERAGDARRSAGTRSEDRNRPSYAPPKLTRRETRSQLPLAG